MRRSVFLLPLVFQSLIVCLSLFFSTISAASEHFPRPAELEPDVDFWLKVYTEIDTKSGFIHDASDLGVVYESIKLSGQYSADKKKIKAAKARYAKILKRLAKAPAGLNSEEQRVLSLWGQSPTTTQLRKAAANLRFQRGQSDRFLEGLARSGEWYGHIEEVLADNKLPRDLAALPHVESSFNPDAYSYVGASGLWQFTRSTGRRYLHIDYVVDERKDPFAATVAAARLLEHNYQLTGSWPLAITAYNHGAAGVRRAIKKLGTTDITPIVRNYKGRYFGFASRNFYVSFLAAREIDEDPTRFFGPYKKALPVEYSQIKITDYLPVDAFARAFNTDFTELKRHNPALLEPVWTGKKHIPKGYTLRVPRDKLTGTHEQLLAAIPASQRFTRQTPDLSHKVVRGDTVSEIAARYGHSIREVAAMNGLDRRYRIRLGQVLKLPLEGSRTQTAADATAPSREPLPTTPAETAAQTALAAAGPAIEPALTTSAGPELIADPSDYTVAGDGSIEVQAAETLGHYAEWLDLRASQLRRINGMRYGRPVMIGQRLKLDFSRVDKNEFEGRRLAYQNELQQNFFMAWQISATRSHVIASGESLWVLTRRQFKVPLWLLRQYNPDLDLDSVHPGTVIVIPELVEA